MPSGFVQQQRTRGKQSAVPVFVNTSNIIITVHAKQQMKKRKVTTPMLYECLQLGQMLREPEENVKKGTLECRMERYCAGCNCTAIVALDDNNPNLICVTVWV